MKRYEKLEGMSEKEIKNIIEEAYANGCLYCKKKALCGCKYVECGYGLFLYLNQEVE